MRDLMATGLAVVMTCVAVLTAIQHWRARQQLPEIPAQYAPSLITDWRTQADRLGQGSQNQPSLVIFSDYLCAFCAELAQDLREWMEREDPALSVQVRHYPHLGDLSFPAAVAAECAREAGHFDEMHLQLFEEIDSLGIRPWTRIASDAGVQDTVGFATCLAGGSAASRVEDDRLAALALGARGTPSLLLDSLFFFGSPGVDYLRTYSRISRLPDRRP